MPPKVPSTWLKCRVSVSTAVACTISSIAISTLKGLLTPGALGPHCGVEGAFFPPPGAFSGLPARTGSRYNYKSMPESLHFSENYYEITYVKEKVKKRERQ